jgi:hypothetical protein
LAAPGGAAVGAMIPAQPRDAEPAAGLNDASIALLSLTVPIPSVDA